MEINGLNCLFFLVKVDGIFYVLQSFIFMEAEAITLIEMNFSEPL